MLLVLLAAVAALVLWRSTVLVGAGGDGFPQSLTWFDLLAVISVALALSTGYRLFNPPVPPTRLPLVPSRLHRLAGSIAEASVFRVGSRADWTLTNPRIGPEHLHLPGREESVRAALAKLGQSRSPGPHGPLRRSEPLGSFPLPAGRGPIGSLTAVPPPEGRSGRGGSDRSQASRRPMAVATDDWVPYTTQRGDTYWTLAERIYGEGARWADLRDANVGRAVASGVVLESSMSLRSGWSILVPVSNTRPPAASGEGL